MMKYTIDRFEGNYAICELEDQSTVSVPKYQLPLGCKEGDCLIKDEDGMFQLDRDEKSVKEKRIRDKMNRIFVRE
jgi:hypothetical protein